VLRALHVQSPDGHMPSLDSDEHAMYGCDVAYEMPEPSLDSLWIHWYGPSSEPPWHEPAPAQLRMCCTESWMSVPLASRAILIRSPSAETEPCAQQLPQYCGMCWLSDGVQ